MGRFEIAKKPANIGLGRLGRLGRLKQALPGEDLRLLASDLWPLRQRLRINQYQPVLRSNT